MLRFRLSETYHLEKKKELASLFIPVKVFVLRRILCNIQYFVRGMQHTTPPTVQMPSKGDFDEIGTAIADPQCSYAKVRVGCGSVVVWFCGATRILPETTRHGRCIVLETDML